MSESNNREGESTQITKEIDDIIENYYGQNKSDLGNIVPKRMDNKAAERSRLYRERHREEINERRRHMRQRQKNIRKMQTESNAHQNTDENNITQATSNNQRSLNPHTLRQQRYYEKHKEDINKRKRENRQKRNNSLSIPATNAERNRNYRERHKQEINERRRESRMLKQIQQIRELCINNIDETLADQQKMFSSNDDTIKVIDLDFTTTPINTSTKHRRVKEIHTAVVHIVEDKEPPSVSTGCTCRSCHDEICGFRYTCLECEGYNICIACESAKEHSAHYMLRVPLGKSQREVNLVLEKLRKELQFETEKGESSKPECIPTSSTMVVVKEELDIKEEIAIKQEDPLTHQQAAAPIPDQALTPEPVLSHQKTITEQTVPKRKRVRKKSSENQQPVQESQTMATPTDIFSGYDKRIKTEIEPNDNQHVEEYYRNVFNHGDSYSGRQSTSNIVDITPCTDTEMEFKAGSLEFSTFKPGD